MTINREKWNETEFFAILNANFKTMVPETNFLQQIKPLQALLHLLQLRSIDGSTTGL